MIRETLYPNMKFGLICHPLNVFSRLRAHDIFFMREKMDHLAFVWGSLWESQNNIFKLKRKQFKGIIKEANI